MSDQAVFSFTLDGGYIDRSPTLAEVFDVYNSSNFNGSIASDVTLTVTEDIGGPTDVRYQFRGIGPEGYSANQVDTFNIVLPSGWYVTYSDYSSDFGGEFYWYVYNDSGTYVNSIFVSGGQVGSVTNVCFTRGAMIETEHGPRRVEDLRANDLVLTRDHGLQPIRWVGASHLSGETIAQFPHLRPIRIKAGALGSNAETLVSPQHRMLVSGWRAEAVLGAAETLVPARDLVNGTTIAVADEVADVEYYHILFDQHEVICSDGAWSESFHAGSLGHGTIDAPTRDEVLALFPDLETNTYLTARPASAPAQVSVFMHM